MTPEQAKALREPFPPAAVGLLPKPTKKDNPKGSCKDCGGWHGLPAVHLDFVGHALVTDRLLTVDPEWSWEPVAFDSDGKPLMTKGADGAWTMWIRLTVCGVTRLGVGSVGSGLFDVEKQLIGDSIRNAAMRFGVALDLWTKNELESALIEPEPVVHPTFACPVEGCDREDVAPVLKVHLGQTHGWTEGPDSKMHPPQVASNGEPRGEATAPALPSDPIEKRDAGVDALMAAQDALSETQKLEFRAWRMGEKLPVDMRALSLPDLTRALDKARELAAKAAA